MISSAKRSINWFLVLSASKWWNVGGLNWNFENYHVKSGFSGNSGLLVKNISKESVVAQCQVFDRMHPPLMTNSSTEH